jgi:hypothetical protein
MIRLGCGVLGIAAVIGEIVTCAAEIVNRVCLPGYTGGAIAKIAGNDSVDNFLPTIDN